MINFSDPKDQLPLGMAGLGLLLILGTGVYTLAFHKQDDKALKRKFNADKKALIQRQNKAQEDLDSYQSFVTNYRWEDKEDTVTPVALSLVSNAVSASGLKMVSFRPQKSIELAGLIELPLQFTVDGSFAGVAHLVEGLEAKGTKLAVQQVQFASQEGDTDRVSATINLLAFLKLPDNKAKKPVTTVSDKKTGGKANG